MNDVAGAGPSVRAEAGVATHTGRVRATNEDSHLARPPVFVVADGMGGHEAGELASAEVVDALATLAGREPVGARDVMDALVDARRRVSAIETPEGRGAGTTVAGVVVSSAGGAPYWLVVNLGDSRTYRFAAGRLEQVSVDHSEVQDLVEAGWISAAEAVHHPRRNVLTRALGAGSVLDPDFWMLPVALNDRILVCTDGLTTEVSDDAIAEILASHITPQGAADALVAAALDAGGRDNVTALVVDAAYLGDGDKIESTAPRAAPAILDDDTVPRDAVRLMRGL